MNLQPIITCHSQGKTWKQYTQEIIKRLKQEGWQDLLHEEEDILFYSSRVTISQRMLAGVKSWIVVVQSISSSPKGDIDNSMLEQGRGITTYLIHITPDNGGTRAISSVIQRATCGSVELAAELFSAKTILIELGG